MLCTKEQYKCVNKLCIEPDAVCDNVNDCGDESDEIGCCKYIS